LEVTKNDRKDLSRARTRDAEETRRNIIDAAMAEFSEKGLTGARVDDIAARTRTTKPMIYYHFKSKAQLYAAVMEEAYGSMRNIEHDLQLEQLPPADAMQRLVEATFDYHAAHPEYVRLISVENIHGAKHIVGVSSIAQRNAIAIQTVRAVLERGVREGIFRPGVDPLHLHLLVSSFCFYRVSNRHTWGVLFERNLLAEEETEKQRRLIVDAVLHYLDPKVVHLG
jgi:AcrR family transcriptional regulator